MKIGDQSLTEKRDRIWIQGAGELASGTAWRLVRCGYRVVMAEVPAPRAIRRLVSFAEAVFAGRTSVEGVPGRLVKGDEASFVAGEVQVLVDPEARSLPRLKPAAIVDARLAKKPPVPLPAGEIPVIGLGPGFLCGRDAVFIIETHREARPGAVLERGEALADTGIPGRVGGETSRRLLRSPAAGSLEPKCRLGDLVQAGQELGQVGGRPLRSEIDGLLRGLIHPAVELLAGDKVGDVDPRGAAVDPRQVSDKSLAVAGGVLEALLRLEVLPDAAG